MASNPTTVVVGIKELAKVFEQLPERLERKVLRAALKAGSKPLLTRARARAQRLARHEWRTLSTGKRLRVASWQDHDPSSRTHLFETLGTRPKTYTRSGVVYLAAGPMYAGGQHGHLVEHGHRMVVGGTVARIKGKAIGKTRYAKNRALTGRGRVVGQVKGKPFLRPAFEESQGAILDAITAECVAKVEKEAAKLAKEAGALV